MWSQFLAGPIYTLLTELVKSFDFTSGVAYLFSSLQIEGLVRLTSMLLPFRPQEFFTIGGFEASRLRKRIDEER